MFKKSMICILSLSIIPIIHAAESQSEKEQLEKYGQVVNDFRDACPEGVPNLFAPAKSWNCYRKYRAFHELKKEIKPLLERVEQKNACAYAAMAYQGCLMSYPPSSGEEACKNCMPQLQVMIEACKKAQLLAKDNTDQPSETNS